MNKTKVDKKLVMTVLRMLKGSKRPAVAARLQIPLSRVRDIAQAGSWKKYEERRDDRNRKILESKRARRALDTQTKGKLARPELVTKTRVPQIETAPVADISVSVVNEAFNRVTVELEKVTEGITRLVPVIEKLVQQEKATADTNNDLVSQIETERYERSLAIKRAEALQRQLNDKRLVPRVRRLLGKTRRQTI